jgi:hypothetical protein
MTDPVPPTKAPPGQLVTESEWPPAPTPEEAPQ